MTHIEPIHDFDADELQDYFNSISEYIEVYDPEISMYFREHLETLLNSILNSIKKSIALILPEQKDLLIDVNDVTEAVWLRYTIETHMNVYPFFEGIDAIVSIYRILDGVSSIASDTNLSDLDFILPELKTMELAVNKYFTIAKEFIFKNKIKLAEPLIRLGMKRKEQLHAPKNKKNNTLINAIDMLWNQKRHDSAMQLMIAFPNSNNPMLIDGCEVHKKDCEDGGLKIIAKYPNGTIKKLCGERAFQNYYSNHKKREKANS